MQKINYPYILVLTAIIFTGLSGMYSAVGAEMVTVHMERGQQYYRSGNYDAALKEFRAVTEIDPGSLTAWENMYWTYRKMEKTDQAIDILKSLISVHPDRPRVLNMMAEAYTAKKDYEQALAVYQESLKEKPGQIDILASRCKILYWAGRHNDAVVCCREFLSSYPEQDEIRLLLAGLQMGNQIADYQAAIDNWKHLIEKRPKDFQLQIGLAKAYYRSESYRQAFEITRGVLELDVENLSALEILLNAAIRIQEFESAQDAIEKLKAVDPNHRDIITGQAQIHDGIAHKLYQEGDYENALERFLLARTLAPRTAPAAGKHRLDVPAFGSY